MKIILSGCCGHMGHVVSEVAGNEIICGVDKFNDGKHDYPVYPTLEEIPEETVKEADCLLDFSIAANVANNIKFCESKDLPLVVAATGLSEEDYSLAEEASKKIPVLISSNMSNGIWSIASLLAPLFKLLGDNYDVEIVEKHHNRKVDAPSGTALLLAEELNKGVDNQFELLYNKDRNGHKREKNELGIVSVRGGTIPGEHTVIFAGNDEVIELKHTAYSRKIFAEGALKACGWIISQKPGLYSMSDVIKLNLAEILN